MCFHEFYLINGRCYPLSYRIGYWMKIVPVHTTTLHGTSNTFVYKYIHIYIYIHKDIYYSELFNWLALTHGVWWSLHGSSRFPPVPFQEDPFLWRNGGCSSSSSSNSSAGGYSKSHTSRSNFQVVLFSCLYYYYYCYLLCFLFGFVLQLWRRCSGQSPTLQLLRTIRVTLSTHFDTIVLFYFRWFEVPNLFRDSRVPGWRGGLCKRSLESRSLCRKNELVCLCVCGTLEKIARLFCMVVRLAFRVLQGVIKLYFEFVGRVT